MSVWISTKKLFGRMKLRKNNKVGPSPEDGLKPDPDYQLDILEYEKEMKAQSKRGAWGLNRKKQSKSNSKKLEKPASETEEEHRTSDEKIGPKELLDNSKTSPTVSVACVTSNDDTEVDTTNEKSGECKENDTVSEDSSLNDEALPQAETSLIEESPKQQSIDDCKEIGQSEEKRSEVNSDKISPDENSDGKSQSLPGCGIGEESDKVPQNDFWDDVAGEYLFSSEEEGEEGEKLGGFSFYADDEEWEEKPRDENLPEQDAFEDKLARLDNWVKTTVGWVSAMLSGSDSESDYESGAISRYNFGSNNLTVEILHITEPDPLLLSMIVNHDWSGVGNQDSLNSTALDNLQLGEPKRRYTKVARTEDWDWTDDEYVGSESSDDSKNDSTMEGSGHWSLDSKISEGKMLAAKASGVTCSPQKACTETLDIISVPENGTISAETTAKSQEIAVRIGLGRRCLRWISRKLGLRNARVTPADTVTTIEALSAQCPNTKAQIGKTNSDKVKPLSMCQSEEVKGQITFAPGHTGNMTETMSSPYRSEQDLKQNPTNKCDSLYGEVTVRKRKAKAGSQDWIRFPGRNY